MQIAIDADSRLVIATGHPQPGNRNDTTVYRTSGIKDQIGDRPVVTDGGYRGNPEVIMPYRKPSEGSELPEWKEDLNAIHRTIRARVEHTLARMKCWKSSATTAEPPAHSPTPCPESPTSTTN